MARFTDEQKEQLITKHKKTYLSNPRRRKVGKELINEEQFDALSLKDRWNPIYLSYVKEKPEINKYRDLINSLNRFKRNMDSLEDKTKSTIMDLINEVVEYSNQYSLREDQKLLEELEAQLKMIDEEKKSIQEQRDLLITKIESK